LIRAIGATLGGWTSRGRGRGGGTRGQLRVLAFPWSRGWFWVSLGNWYINCSPPLFGSRMAKFTSLSIWKFALYVAHCICIANKWPMENAFDGDCSGLPRRVPHVHRKMADVELNDYKR